MSGLPDFVWGLDPPVTDELHPSGNGAVALVEFVVDDEMVSWCPLGAVILGGERMGSLNLQREADQQVFCEILVKNECACPRCFYPHFCRLESINFERVVGRIRCERCGFRFRWYASEAAWNVYEDPNLLADQAAGNWGRPWYPEVESHEERDDAQRTLREYVSHLRCPICREDLLHPIRYRSGLARVVCRNAGCRQQWGFNPQQGSRPKTAGSHMRIEAAA